MSIRIRAATTQARPQLRVPLALRAALAAALMALGMLMSPASARAAECQPPSHCSQSGACLSIAQVTRQVSAEMGDKGFSVASVRLKSGAPTETCLMYEVLLRDRAGRTQVIYWDVTGGRIG